MSFDILFEKEETQIHGFQLLVDLNDVKRKTLEVLGDPKLAKESYRALQVLVYFS